MSKKNDQSDLGISLREMASIWDSGKKLTRGAKQQLKQSFSQKQIGQKQSQVSFDSKKSIETKKDAKKVDKNAKKKENSIKTQKISVTEYLGVPDLESYIGSEDLTPKSYYTLDKFSIGELSKHHLPSLIRVILKNNLAKQHYEVKRGQLKKQKTTRETFLIDLSCSSGGRSDVRSITKDNGIVLVGENLAMMKVSFEDWREMFSEEIEELHKEMRRLIEEEESDRIDEEKEEKVIEGSYMELEQDKIEKQNNALDDGLLMNDQNPIVTPLPNPLVPMSQHIIEQQKSMQFIQIHPNQSSQILSSSNQDQKQPLQQRQDHESNNNQQQIKQYHHAASQIKETLDEKKLFNKFCIPGCDFILWPVMIYETVIGDAEEAMEIIRSRQYVFSDKDKGQHMFDTIEKGGLFQGSVARQVKSQSLLSQPEDDLHVFDQLTSTFHNNILPNICHPIVDQQPLNPSQLNLIIYPFGSGKLLLLASTQEVQTKLVTWDKFPDGFLNAYLLQSNFKQCIEEINQAIERLNEFIKWQVSECKIEEIRNSIDRLVKCRVEDRVYNGITLRYSNIQKKVLVLVFANCEGTSNQLIWLNLEQIFPNYTIPQLNLKNKFLLYFSNLHPHRPLTAFIHDIYTSYFHKPIPNILISNQYYNPAYFPHPYNPAVSISDRCVKCVYPIRKQPFFKCCFCDKYSHRQCSTKSVNKGVEMNFQAVNGLWTCGACEPCTLCLQPLKNRKMACMKCGNMFHQICGKLKIQQNSMHRDRYLCENCIQCKICQKKLKNQDYSIIKDGSYQCSSCLKAEELNQICHICKKQGDGRWAQCSREFCGKWIHKNCDKYIQSRNNFFLTNNEQVYFCPFCRRVEKRRIILKFIEILTVFDEYQYFIGSDYEDLLDYKYVIGNPMCFRKMYERCHEGAYDEDTKENLLRDFELLVSNALKYNMPKDQPHYQARILNILGSYAIQKFHSVLECTQEDLIKGGLLMTLQEKRRELHKEIYDRYLEIILNYKSLHSTVEVKKPKEAVSKGEKMSHYHPGDGEHFVFSSRHLLKEVFKSSMLKFKTSKKPPTIGNLFEIQKVIDAYKCSIKESFCYYHYWNSNVIFYCAICMEHYCCTTKCYKHYVCTYCGVKGCACDTSECGCPPLKQKQRKTYEKIIHQRYYDRRQITQNFSLCLRCACQKLSTKICCYCDKAYEFYYDFQTCTHCHKVYHKQCGDVHASQSMSRFFFKKEKQFPNQELFSSNHRLQKACYECSIVRGNKDKMFEKLKADSIAKLKKLQKLGKFQPLISSIYQQNGIKINLNEILMLILNNYDDFLEYESLFEEYKMNFPSIRLNTKLGQRSLERVQHLVKESAFNKVNEIKAEVQSKMQLLKKNAFSGLFFGSAQDFGLTNVIEPSYIWKEKFTQKSKEFIFKNITIPSAKQQQSMRKIKLEFMIDHYQRSRIHKKTSKLQQSNQKINVVNIVTLPTSKKNTNTQSNQKIPLWSKSHIQTASLQKSNGSKTLISIEDKSFPNEFLAVIYDEHCFKTFTEIQIEKLEALRIELADKRKQEVHLRPCLLEASGASKVSLLGVFSIVSPLVYERSEDKINERQFSQVNQTIEKAQKLNQGEILHEQQKNQSLIPQIDIQTELQLVMNKINISSKTKPRNPPSHSLPTLQQRLMKIHINHTNMSKTSKYKRLSTLHAVIRGFLLRCFEMNKPVYRRGNTCVLKAENGHWRVLKKGRKKGDYFEITLKKEKNKWFFSINESTWWIESIDQIISKLKPLVQISSFRDLADFLGFTFKFIPVEKATHFTRFLQTNPLQDMTPLNKKRVILELYDKLDWLRSGSFKNKVTEPGKEQIKEYQTTKRKIFYLGKRKSKVKQEEKETKIKSSPPYISFEDLKKDLDDTLESKKQQPIILTEPGDNVFIGPSPIHKLGLFAKSYFPKHTTMVQYIGEVLSESTADVRESRFHFGCYMFGLNRRNCDKREIIDATFKGNMARYLNHSCDPNCKARIEIVNGQPSIFIYSIREIGQFEELTYDYQFSVDGEEKLVCTCGAKNCQGRLN